jgi:hypothetical protein
VICKFQQIPNDKHWFPVKKYLLFNLFARQCCWETWDGIEDLICASFDVHKMGNDQS